MKIALILMVILSFVVVRLAFDYKRASDELCKALIDFFKEDK